MRPINAVATLVGAAVIAMAGIGYADDKTDIGKREYDSNCAVCHGRGGKGDGPYTGIIDTRIADLTILSKNNGGVFPFARVYATINGTDIVKAHGTRDMPIWGKEYNEFPHEPESYVRARTLALTEYIYRLQGK